MPKKFVSENSKVTAAKERKALVQKEKDAVSNADRERREAESWSEGAKKNAKKEAEERKRAEKAARKIETDALLKQELKEIKLPPKKKVADITPKLASANPATAPTIAVTSAVAQIANDGSGAQHPEPLEDDETIVEEKKKKIAHQMTLAALDRHPERRARAAWQTYLERELPVVRLEFPGTRRSTLEKMIRRQWDKSPENPMNKSMLSYNASAEEEEKILELLKECDLNKPDRS